MFLERWIYAYIKYILAYDVRHSCNYLLKYIGLKLYFFVIDTQKYLITPKWISKHTVVFPRTGVDLKT